MIYKFNCAKCGEIEVSMSHKDLPLKECPTCQTPNPERIWQATNNVWRCDGAYSKQNHKYL